MRGGEMFRSRLFTIATFAGVLAFGAAAVTQCGTPGSGPSPSTTTTTTMAPLEPQGQLGVAPSDGPAGTVVRVQGSFCRSDAGHIEVFLATTEAPSTRLSESDAIAVSTLPANWSVELTIPQGTASGSDYVIEAQCWGDGTGLGHPGQQVEYFAYTGSSFTVD